MFLLNKFLFLINFVFAILLLASYAAPNVSPSLFWPIAFLGLSYPIILLVNLFFVVYWLIQFKITFLYSGIAIFLGFNHLLGFYKFSGKAFKEESNETYVKIMSFNCHGFDSEIDFNHFQNYIEEERIDIVCLQEFVNKPIWDKKKPLTNKLKKNSQLKYYFYNKLGTSGHSQGTVIFSRYPIVYASEIDFAESGNGAVYTDVKIGKDTLRVFSVHLQSNQLARSRAINGLDLENKNVAISKSRHIMSRLKNGFQLRAWQAQRISDLAENSPFPVLIGGDFNDTHLSYAYNQISNSLSDAFVESGKGICNTYLGPFPSFRIDHILHDKSFQSFDFKTSHAFGSDHKSVQAIVKIKN